MLMGQLVSWEQCTPNDVATVACVGVVLVRILQIVGTIALFIFFIMTILAGFRFLASQGDPKALEKARGTLTHALLGLVLLVAAFLILRLIDEFAFGGTGTSLLKFSLP